MGVGDVREESGSGRGDAARGLSSDGGRLSVRRSLILYAGFAASGAGCALPGALLPVLLAHWHWHDAHAGALFFAITAGSAMAPLLLRGRLRESVAGGHVLIACGALLWRFQILPPLLAGFVFGLGLGFVMTGIVLWMARLAGAASGRVLARLNVLWALGAACCPPLLTHALRTRSPAGVLQATAIVFGALAVVTLLVRAPATAAKSAKAEMPTHDAHVPLAWIAAAALATGVEAATGAWIATYAQREGHALAAIVLTPAMFWGGLFVSRLCTATSAGAHWLVPRVRWLAVLTAVAAVAVLLPMQILLPVFAFAMGFGLGPLYPELVARILARREARSVFFLAGVISATMPWLAGLLSSATHSLRIGMIIPALGALVLLLCAWRVAEPIGT